MKQKLFSPSSIVIIFTVWIIACFFEHCHPSTPVKESGSGNTTPDSLAFGDTKWISNGMKGRIYFLPENTSQLPVFDTLRPVGTLYTRTLDIAARSWDHGFPGVSNRFEWFGIEYKGYFRVKKAGHYTFRLLSDDGAKLFIDGKLVVNNDGLHGPGSASGETDIDNSRHSIVVQYYQGPRYQIALQLFARLDKEEEQVFPGGNFILTTPGSCHPWVYVIIVIIVITVNSIAWYIRTRRSARR